MTEDPTSPGLIAAWQCANENGDASRVDDKRAMFARYEDYSRVRREIS